ncbi:MAG: endonuclease/exonuclease/phosphatase family protein [Planctomycetes bacterium]|nr:endonuclease/exonuclease/phosphatase family protein [Planctomycetota bacterium]
MTRMTAVLALALCVLAGTSAADGPPPAPAAPPGITAMTFNLRIALVPDGWNAWPFRAGFVADVIRREDPDVVGAQETLGFAAKDLLRRLPEYAVLGKPGDADFWLELNAIFYRRDRLEALDSGILTLSDTPEKRGSRTWDNVASRSVLWARFRQRAGGRCFYFYDTHLDHRGGDSKTRGARVIRDLVARQAAPAEPALLTGDFNCNVAAPAWRILTGAQVEEGRAGDFRDAWLAVHGREPEEGTYHGYTGHSVGARIDFVLARPGLRAVRADILRDRRGPLFPSDHYPVIARFEWE